MADYKSGYSDASSNYVNNTINLSEKDKERYEKSKARELIFNENWSKQKVNLNDIVNEFAPNSTGKTVGMKYLFKGSKYTVEADMSAGYLRIKINNTKKYLTLKGEVSYNKDLTHFKIKKREEM